MFVLGLATEDLWLRLEKMLKWTKWKIGNYMQTICHKKVQLTAVNL